MTQSKITKTLKITLLSIGCFIAGTQSIAQPNTLPSPLSDIVIKTHTHSHISSHTLPLNGRFQSREHFVKALLPHAIMAGKTLGVDPKVILAQAALESNWGQSILRHTDRRVSHNIFAIKHTSTKAGNSLTVRTKEFHNGKSRYQRESFRSYNNFREAFEDYTRIIQKAHYRKHMRNLRTPLDYAVSLQRAGYATDPKYATKIMQKYHDPVLKNIRT